MTKKHGFWDIRTCPGYPEIHVLSTFWRGLDPLWHGGPVMYYYPRVDIWGGAGTLPGCSKRGPKSDQKRSFLDHFGSLFGPPKWPPFDGTCIFRLLSLMYPACTTKRGVQKVTQNVSFLVILGHLKWSKNESLFEHPFELKYKVFGP